MNTSAINIHHPFIEGLHAVLREEYNCCLCDIIGTRDTGPKLVAVFILRYFYSYRQRDIAQSYSINFHYVPTVVERCKTQYANDCCFESLVQRVLNKLDFYEEVAGM